MRTLWVSPLSVAAPSLVGPVPRGDVLYDRRSLIAPIAVLIPAKPKFRLSKFSLAGGLLTVAKCHQGIHWCPALRSHCCPPLGSTRTPLLIPIDFTALSYQLADLNLKGRFGFCVARPTRCDRSSALFLITFFGISLSPHHPSYPQPAYHLTHWCHTCHRDPLAD